MPELSAEVRRDLDSAIGASSSSILAELASHKSLHVRLAVAGNLRTSPDTLRLLSSDREAKVRRKVARHPSAPTIVLEKLSVRRDDHCRKYIASNPNTSPEVLLRLARDSNTDVIERVLGNKNAPKEVFLLLARSPDASIRIRVIKFGESRTPLEVFENLLSDTAITTQRALAESRYAPSHVLHSLLERSPGCLYLLLLNPRFIIHEGLSASLFISPSSTRLQDFLKEQLSRLSPPEQLHVTTLLPEWSGSLGSLTASAKLLAV